MKYELEQVIYYMLNNKPHNAPVLSRRCIENAHEDLVANECQDTFFKRFGDSGVVYSTCHTEVAEEEAYSSKEDMIRTLCDANGKS